MSKQNPNQDYYKIGGREQTDGPDRGNAIQEDRQQLGQVDKNAKNGNHPAARKAKKK
jgi:hypothetical protein